MKASVKIFENILIDILLPKSKPFTLGIIYRPHDQSIFSDDFDVVLKRLASQDNETYFLGDFNINFFYGHYVLKKSVAALEKDHPEAVSSRKSHC